MTWMNILGGAGLGRMFRDNFLLEIISESS